MAVATIKGEGDTALEAEAQLYSYIKYRSENNASKSMQIYRTSQVGGRASQVGGITCMFKVKERIIEPSVMAVIRPRWR